jgi:hypothetical protein
VLTSNVCLASPRMMAPYSATERQAKMVLKMESGFYYVSKQMQSRFVITR